MFSRQRIALARCALLVLLTAPLASGAHAEPFTLRPVARTGETAPGGGTFDRFGTEAHPIMAPVNARGEVAFFATLARGGADEGIFLRRGTRTIVIAREGDRVAGAGRLSGFAKHTTPALNDAGVVAFAAAVAGGRAVEGIFTWSGGRTRVVALTGAPAPGIVSGALAGVEAPVINARGDIAFLATIRRGRETIEAILLHAGGTLRKIVAQGDPAPAGGTFAAFGLPAINGNGTVAFSAAIEGRAVPGGIFVATGERLRMALGAGDETPVGGIFAKFSERIGISDQGVIAFHGILKLGPVAAAIFAIEGGATRVIARLGEPAPGGGTFSHFGLWPGVGATGTIAFAASIDEGPTPVAILVTEGGNLRRVIGVGDAVPGGKRIASLTLYPVVSVSPRGAVSFAVAPTATGEGPEGLFLAEPAAAH